MISETDINSEKTTIMEIAEEVEKDGTTSAEDVKSEKNVTESTFSEEEYVILKEKVEKLEGLLTKCRGTIVNNKEKVKRLSEDKQGIQHRFEHQLDTIKMQYEQEMNNKFCGMQEQIQCLTEGKDKLQGELDDMINLKGEDLIKKLRCNHEKELESCSNKIKSLNDQLSEVKKTHQSTSQQNNTTSTTTTTFPTTTQSSDTTTTDESTTTTSESTTTNETTPTTTQTTVNVEPEEHKRVMKQLEARSEELIGVMEERSSLRKELVSQRERFTLVLERYDSQMKVVQEELRLRMMPGPEEESMAKQVVSAMAEDDGGEVKPDGGDITADKGGEKVATKSSSSVEKRLEEAEGKVVKLLELLERCARKADEKEAECLRWSGRFTELTEKQKSSASEAAETVKRLEKQVSEMTIRDKDLNEELEKTQRENGDMLRAQRSEMGDLQKVVDRLIANEDFLKTQMSDIKTQCDTEVARANKENEAAMDKLKGMFEENKKAVGELFEQLTQSKTKSNEVLKELETELDYRYRQLDAARTYINSLKEGKTPPAEPALEAIFSNMPNFIYVDDAANGGKNGDGEKKENIDGEKNGEDKKKEDENKKENSNAKAINASDKNKKNNSKPIKSSKK